MGESGVRDNEIPGQYDWEHILDGIPDDWSLLDDILTSDATNSSRDSVPLTIDDIDQFLLGDGYDNEETRGDTTVVEEEQLDILSDYLLDSPLDSDHSAEIVDLTDGGKNVNSPSSSEEELRDVIPPQDKSGDPTNKKVQR